jgi:hypothetical protein
MLRIRGDAGRVFVCGRQVGNLYAWCFTGGDGDWLVTAEKYRLAEIVEGDVDLVFTLGRLEIKATGRFIGDRATDNEVHRATVEVRGSHVWITTEPPSA